jgi:hypothetical protein
MIKAALADARAELAALDARRSEPEALISQGEAALGDAHQAVGQTILARSARADPARKRQR